MKGYRLRDHPTVDNSKEELVMFSVIARIKETEGLEGVCESNVTYPRSHSDEDGSRVTALKTGIGNGKRVVKKDWNNKPFSNYF